MRTEQVEIVNKLGIHARSASKFVSVAKGFPCQIKVGRTDSELQNGKSIMGVLTIAAQRGATIVLQTHGEEEEEAMAALVVLIENKFGEPE